MGLLGELDKRSLGGILSTAGIIFLLDYFLSVYFFKNSPYNPFSGDVLLSASFYFKGLLIVFLSIVATLFIIYSVLSKIGVNSDLQVAAAMGLVYALVIHLNPSFTYHSGIIMVISHTIASYAGLKLYEVAL